MKNEIERLTEIAFRDEAQKVSVTADDLRAVLAHINTLTHQQEEARATIRKAHDALGPAVAHTAIASKIAPPIYQAFGILRDALPEYREQQP